MCIDSLLVCEFLLFTLFWLLLDMLWVGNGLFMLTGWLVTFTRYAMVRFGFRLFRVVCFVYLVVVIMVIVVLTCCVLCSLWLWVVCWRLLLWFCLNGVCLVVYTSTYYCWVYLCLVWVWVCLFGWLFCWWDLFCAIRL